MRQRLVRPLVLGLLHGCSARTAPPADGARPVHDGDDHPTEQHSGAAGETGAPPPASIVINELMAGNGSTINGPGLDGTPDWVEIVNTGAEPFALSRLQLRNRAQDGLWTGTADDGSIGPGDRDLVWLGEGGDEGGVFTGFSLDKDGDGLLVVVDGVFQEEIEVEGLAEDVSWARTPDLTGPFAATAWPTPGGANPDEPTPTLDAADATVFRTDVVHQIHLVVSDRGYVALDELDRPEVHAQLSFDGVALPDVGLRLKGTSSSAPMSGKPGFVVDVNEWVPGTRLRGLQAFRLHNGLNLDPTRVREHVTYGLARAAGLMAPRVGWAEVWVHHPSGLPADAYYGLYVLVEAHDDRFVEYHRPGHGDVGVVLEPNSAFSNSDFGAGLALGWEVEEGPEPADPASVRSLATCDEILGRPPTDENVAELWTCMEKDLLLAYLAWESLVNHTDGYKATNNWRVFVDGATHRVSLLPSGAEWTWDRTDWFDVFGFGGNAGVFCVANEGCKRDLAAEVLVVADLVETLDLAGAFEDQSLFLDPLVQSDPRYPQGRVEEARASTGENLRRYPDEAREQVYAAYPELRP